MSRSVSWEIDFERQGFAVIRGLLDQDLVELARRNADRIQSDWQDGMIEFESKELLRVLAREQPASAPILDGIQGVFHHFPAFASLRANPAVVELLESRLGRSLVSVVDTLFFKPPAQLGTGIAFHRDAQFRKPAENFRDLDLSYVQVGIPLERHGSENGGMVFAAGSHRDLSIDATQERSVRGIENLDATLGMKLGNLVHVEAVPGDVLVWHPYTIHGSPPNRSESQSRKFYVVGYMASDACDVGHAIALTDA